jgi:hypothetical protein
MEDNIGNVTKIRELTNNWSEDEKKLITIPLILHELRHRLVNSTIHYYYTSESGKSCRFKIMSYYGGNKFYDVRVDLTGNHQCRLLRNGRVTYLKFENIEHFCHYFNENIKKLSITIGVYV